MTEEFEGGPGPEQPSAPDPWAHLPDDVRALVAGCEAILAQIDESFGPRPPSDNMTATEIMEVGRTWRNPQRASEARRAWMAAREPIIRQITGLTAHYMPPIIIRHP